MEFLGETFLYPVIDGQSLAAPSTKFQYFYPCDGSQVPVVDGDFTGYGDLRPLATVLGTDMSASNPVITLPTLASPAAGVQWFISNVGVYPTQDTPWVSGDSVPVVGEISLLPAEVNRTYNPSEWVACNGNGLRVADNPALFSLLGYAFGGDGSTYFLSPNIPSPFPGMIFAMSAAGAVPPLVPVDQEAPA
ncbi:hypothetical protein BH10ACT3_BH10ACT3_04090 [soil metagenome]